MRRARKTKVGVVLWFTTRSIPPMILTPGFCEWFADRRWDVPLPAYTFLLEAPHYCSFVKITDSIAQEAGRILPWAKFSGHEKHVVWLAVAGHSTRGACRRKLRQEGNKVSSQSATSVAGSVSEYIHLFHACILPCSFHERTCLPSIPS